MGEGQTIALSATPGLLKLLTGHCTGLQTLILRRIGEYDTAYDQHAAASEASYIKWATFICSVQSTVEIFTFEHVGGITGKIMFTDEDRRSRMNERFRRLNPSGHCVGKLALLDNDGSSSCNEFERSR